MRSFDFFQIKYDQPWALISNFLENHTLAFTIISLTTLIIGITLLIWAYRRSRATTVQMEKKLAYQATHDPLTDLPNRAAFNLYVLHTLTKATLKNLSLSIIFIDLDDFKTINNALGHPVGDRLLVEISKRFKKILRKKKHLDFSKRTTDFLARLGGDEFAFVLTYPNDRTDAEEYAEKILEQLKTYFAINGQSIYMSASIGICTYPEGALDSITLLQNADIAMYRAKKIGKNNFQFYIEAFRDTYTKRLFIETGLYEALSNNHLYLAYQPQYELSTQKLRGVEALIRWNHPILGPIFPDDFITVAEKTRLILLIGSWTLRTACEEYMRWKLNNQIPDDIKLAINVSSHQLAKKLFIDDLKKIIRDTKISPSILEFEITETALMTELADFKEVLMDLLTIGVGITIDDFGTGYSSLSQIKRLPVRAIKIDKSFMTNITTDENDAAIVKAIVVLAKTLNLTAIAEGTETKSQVDALIAMGCPFAQGHYFAKPMPSGELIKYLTKTIQPSK